MKLLPIALVTAMLTQIQGFISLGNHLRFSALARAVQAQALRDKRAISWT